MCAFCMFLNINQIQYIVQEEASEGHNEEFINLSVTQSPVYFLLAKHDMMIQSFFMFVPLQGEVSEQ